MKKNMLWALTGFVLVLALSGCPTDGGGSTDPALSGTITISPSSGVTTGTLLTAAYTGGESVTYQWNKGGTTIAGGTGATYTPGEAESYTVTVSAAGYQSKTSAAVTVTGASLPALSGTITITDGTNPVTSSYTGTQLTATYSGGSETVAYQWNKGETAITGGTGAAYTPTEAGSYTVTVSAAGYQSKTSAAVNVTVDPVPLMNAEDFPGVAATDITTRTISNKAEFTDAKTAIEGTGGNYVLTITGTVVVDNVQITPKENAKVSLRGGGTLHLSTGTQGLFLLNKANSKLILRDAVLKGNAGSEKGLVLMDESSAEFVMYGGTITGNTADAGDGGTGTGGGVGVHGTGTFTMTGGTISGNTARAGGGVAFTGTGTFTKTGGTIYGDNDTTNTPPENTATLGAPGTGHAVYFSSSSGDKYRNTTAGTGVNLDSTTNDNWGE
ncbi:hypothetical protein AGMMS49546_31060 [Spirochaetia bacterium]|nr:hypothetical protein AGMMS49546_31060 [Spirochaetia bacterium]